ncbi:hypothetical protein GCM10027456_40130 [Kineosporia babensis]
MSCGRARLPALNLAQALHQHEATPVIYDPTGVEAAVCSHRTCPTPTMSSQR